MCTKNKRFIDMRTMIIFLKNFDLTDSNPYIPIIIKNGTIKNALWRFGISSVVNAAVKGATKSRSKGSLLRHPFIIDNSPRRINKISIVDKRPTPGVTYLYGLAFSQIKKSVLKYVPYSSKNLSKIIPF